MKSSAARTSYSHPHPRPKTSTTPSTHLAVGCAMPPNPAVLRSPGIQDIVRTPSPNYFGLTADSTSDPGDSGVGPRDNWSPPTSSIQSSNAHLPLHVPLDANPDIETFRRQADANSVFGLGHGNLLCFSATLRPTASRQRSDRAAIRDGPANTPRPTPDQRAERGLPGGPAATIRQAEASGIAPPYLGLPRHESPMAIEPTAPTGRPEPRTALSPCLDDRHQQLSLPLDRADPLSPNAHQETHHRANTLPSTLEDGPVMIRAGELKDILERAAPQQFLLLDLRVSPQFAQLRIKGALNLCIPTTLLKRPSFNLDRLADTFKDDEERAHFSRWRECQYIIVYDARSTEKRDAISALNTLKKFTHEGWNGRACILRGGVSEFSQMYPHLVEQHPGYETQSSRRLALSTTTPSAARIAGGCAMPSAQSAANPFFSNIRQNMDLLGGVGQMEVARPEALGPGADAFLPQWLRRATAPGDHGKAIADKFLRIEQDELCRMQKALSSRVSYETMPEAGPERGVQIAGFEKGGKNRYNNVWPFEHARVRLQGRPEGTCDYVNASHIKATWSNKRYIASQGPLPDTFEDFWSVVWDQGVRVIVMLTAESEGGQLKCHPYWAAKEYGAFRLKTLSEKRVWLDLQRHRGPGPRPDAGRRRANTSVESLAAASSTAEQPFVIVRKFTLSHSPEPFSPMREITQLHYASWPDFGAPAQPSHLLGLVELSNSLHRAASAPPRGPIARAGEPEDSGDARPLLVHCSAGCGRTGTFCTVDSVVDMLKRQRMEQRSGAAPMEIASDNGADIAAMEGGKDMNDDWIFSDQRDLIEKTVEDFRRQRISMVQSLRQYVLCYETVLEWISQQHQAGRRERSGSESKAG